MLTVPIINNIRLFLDRVQLHGREVSAFNEVIEALAVEEQYTLMSQEPRAGGQLPLVPDASEPQEAAAS